MALCVWETACNQPSRRTATLKRQSHIALNDKRSFAGRSTTAIRTSYLQELSSLVNRQLSTLAILASSLCVGGCDAHPESQRASRKSSFRVALITPGPISDRSWNGGAYAGLLHIRDSLGAAISHIQSRTPAEFDENFRLYGTQGYQLVIGHGYEFQDAALRVAPQFRNTIYLITSGAVSDTPNVAGIRFAFEEPSYMAGVIAGAITKSGSIGAIGGTELPPVKASFDAFAAGARSWKPNVRVVTSYIGNWDDVSAGREQALAQIARGADVIFQNADAAGLGVFQAARQSGKALVFGSNSNQNDVAPEVTLGSVVIDLPRAFLQVAREVKDGTFRARVFDMGAATEVVRLVLNPAREADIPVPVRRAVDSIWAGMKTGTLIPSGARAPASDEGRVR
ncbi:MAG: BMP family protein [Gemmatimonadaceae bacterium]